MLIWLFACAPAEPPPSVPVVAAPARVVVKETKAEAREFGAYPLCEPSALLPLDDGTLLVADNEGRPADPKDDEDARPTLWVASTAADRPPVSVARDEVAQDAEALVRLGDELWILGSLSRNKSCEVKGKRWEIHVVAPAAFTADGLKTLTPRRVLEQKKGAIAEIESSVDGCQRILFGGLAEAATVCSAMVEAAKSPAGQPCDTLNVEGAVAVDGRVWLGLRSPVVDGKAVLVRMAEGHQTLAFDAVRLVDLGGLGVRELVVDGDRLVGIAGTPLDATGPNGSKLFAVPVAGLVDGPLPVEILDPDLPSSAESFLLEDGRVTYLIDGQSTKEEATRCEKPAALVVRSRR